MSNASTSGAPPLNWRDFDAPTTPPLLQSAVDAFVLHGYHGTSIRSLASHAGLSVPGLYHHYDSKHAILVDIMRFAMDDLYARSTAAIAEAGASVEHQARAAIECLVLFHVHRADLAFLAASEIRSLQTTARSEHLARRDRQQRLLVELVDRGVSDGIFRPDSPRLTTRAVITMCTGVAQWFRKEGDLTPAQVTEHYVAVSMRALGA